MTKRKKIFTEKELKDFTTKFIIEFCDNAHDITTSPSEVEYDYYGEYVGPPRFWWEYFDENILSPHKENIIIYFKNYKPILLYETIKEDAIFEKTMVRVSNNCDETPRLEMVVPFDLENEKPMFVANDEKRIYCLYGIDEITKATGLNKEDVSESFKDFNDGIKNYIAIE